MDAKRVLVTGSSRGIGNAIAKKLANEGWQVAIHYSSSKEEAEQLRADLNNSAAGIYQADLSVPSNATTLIDKVISDGSLDALVNNAGVYENTNFLENDDHEIEAAFERIFNVNWHSPRKMISRACKHFSNTGGGKIVNIVSRVAHKGEANASGYSASKAALLNLTRALAVEMADKNIQHFAIAPGWVKTAMSREGMETRLQQLLKEIPAGRMATPEDCAAAAAYLLSDEATYLTGTVIDINGASYLR